MLKVRRLTVQLGGDGTFGAPTLLAVRFFHSDSPRFRFPMNDSDARRIQDWLDSALDVFSRNAAELSPREKSIRTMLAVARRELDAESLEQVVTELRSLGGPERDSSLVKV